MRRFLFLIPIAMLFVFLARPAFGTLSSCGDAAMTSYPVGNNPPSGCGQTDLGFTNFASTGTPASNVTISAFGGTPVLENLTMIELDLDSNGYFLTSSDTKTFTAFNTVQVIGAADGGQSPPAPDTTYAITSLGAGAGANDFTNTSDSIVTKTYFCLNTLAACSIATADGELDDTITANLSSTTSYCLYDGMGGCSETGDFDNPLFLPAPAFEISFVSTITLHDAGGTGNDVTGDMAIDFYQTGESPEPATFALAGSALLLLFGRRLRDYRFAIASRPRVLNLLIRQISKPAHQNERR